MQRTDTWRLPPVALREAVVNAVVHADHAQRGQPIRVGDLWRGVSQLRNRVMGRVVKVAGLIRKIGSSPQDPKRRYFRAAQE